MTARAARLRRVVPIPAGPARGRLAGVFFVVPLAAILPFVDDRELGHGFTLTWNFDVYPGAIDEYSTQFGRSFLYGGCRR